MDRDRTKTKAVITVGKFDNLDARVARVVEVSDPVMITDSAGVCRPHRVLQLDLAELGVRTSVGQFALVPREELLGRFVVAVCNFAPRLMGGFTSEARTLGTRHPASPADQSQAVPLYAHPLAAANDGVY